MYLYFEFIVVIFFSYEFNVDDFHDKIGVLGIPSGIPNI